MNRFEMAIGLKRETKNEYRERQAAVRQVAGCFGSPSAVAGRSPILINLLPTAVNDQRHLRDCKHLYRAGWEASRTVED